MKCDRPVPGAVFFCKFIAAAAKPQFAFFLSSSDDDNL